MLMGVDEERCMDTRKLWEERCMDTRKQSPEPEHKCLSSASGRAQGRRGPAPPCASHLQAVVVAFQPLILSPASTSPRDAGMN